MCHPQIKHSALQECVFTARPQKNHPFNEEILTECGDQFQKLLCNGQIVWMLKVVYGAMDASNGPLLFCWS